MKIAGELGVTPVPVRLATDGVPVPTHEIEVDDADGPHSVIVTYFVTSAGAVGVLMATE